MDLSQSVTGLLIFHRKLVSFSPVFFPNVCPKFAFNVKLAKFLSFIFFCTKLSARLTSSWWISKFQFFFLSNTARSCRAKTRNLQLDTREQCLLLNVMSPGWPLIQHLRLIVLINIYIIVHWSSSYSREIASLQSIHKIKTPEFNRQTLQIDMNKQTEIFIGFKLPQRPSPHNLIESSFVATPAW